MDVIRVSRKLEREVEWELTIIVGHESNGVGFLVRVDKVHWEELTGGRHPPEDLVRRSFVFLLRKKKSVFTIPRNFNIRDIQKQFAEYEDEMKKR